MRLIALLVALVVGVVLVAPVLADDSVSPFPSSVTIGQQFEVVVQVDAPAGAEVELNLVARGWNFVEVVRVIHLQPLDLGGGTWRHTFNLTLAAFALGDREIVPSVFITQDGVSVERALPAGTLFVASTLPENAPLQLSPIIDPGAVAGAQSLWLVPIAVGSVVLGVAFVTALLVWLTRWWLRRPRVVPTELPESAHSPDIGAVEADLLANPVAAYRAMAALVREALARRYGFPARALTTRELSRRMEAEGVDRWQARLVGGVLEACDAVVYAGYLPAPERRTADLTMALQVLEATG